MKRSILLVLIVVLSAAAVFAGGNEEATSSFPEKPIKIIVYTKAGGALDITARKFTDIASKYTDATFVVENKVGAGGIVAMEYVLAEKADGYTLMGATKSNIAKVISTESDIDLMGFNWFAMLMADPEAIITNRNMEIDTWEEIAKDGKAAGGNQLWVGPAAGGLDHVTAMKIWEKAGFEAKWVPFSSGGTAMAALLGEQGVAYVGNPFDTAGKPDLKVAAVSSAERLPQYPDTPTFEELGVVGLENEIMWRGFAVKAGVSDDIIAWYQNIFEQVTDDPEWRDFYEPNGITVFVKKTAEFTEIIKQDIADFKQYLGK
ncbi:MAG: tripartite tricarboxylate transporter substrate binding protein [Spirochaetales bacterium]|mgnify:CR=1 FL=1|nr:tripartite tricarboxylate transporter substrate binding protein [Spirochaetales bacterium]